MRPWMIAATMLFLACAPSQRGLKEVPAAARIAVTLPMDTTQILFTVTGLDGPEAVRYDPGQDVFFVASFGEAAEHSRDANGYISRVRADDGRIEALRFATGTAAAPLHMPRGMYIRGNTLWVVDVDGVHGFDRHTGEHAVFIDFSAHEPGFLNDIAGGPGGQLYVTDTGLGRVYQFTTKGHAEVALDGLEPGPPNGIAWDPARSVFLLAPWEGYRSVRTWDPVSREVEALAEMPGGRFDGIETLEDGSILVASQDDTSVHRIAGDGSIDRLIRTPGRPADIGIDTRRGHIAVPYIALGRVDVWRLP